MIGVRKRLRRSGLFFLLLSATVTGCFRSTPECPEYDEAIEAFDRASDAHPYDLKYEHPDFRRVYDQLMAVPDRCPRKAAAKDMAKAIQTGTPAVRLAAATESEEETQPSDASGPGPLSDLSPDDVYLLVKSPGGSYAQGRIVCNEQGRMLAAGAPWEPVWLRPSDGRLLYVHARRQKPPPPSGSGLRREIRTVKADRLWPPNTRESKIPSIHENDGFVPAPACDNVLGMAVHPTTSEVWYDCVVAVDRYHRASGPVIRICGGPRKISEKGSVLCTKRIATTKGYLDIIGRPTSWKISHARAQPGGGFRVATIASGGFELWTVSESASAKRVRSVAVLAGQRPVAAAINGQGRLVMIAQETHGAERHVLLREREGDAPPSILFSSDRPVSEECTLPATLITGP